MDQAPQKQSDIINIDDSQVAAIIGLICIAGLVAVVFPKPIAMLIFMGGYIFTRWIWLPRIEKRLKREKERANG